MRKRVVVITDVATTVMIAVVGGSGKVIVTAQVKSEALATLPAKAAAKSKMLFKLKGPGKLYKDIVSVCD